MALLVAEFEIGHNLKSSDGTVLETYDVVPHVAIYDTAKISSEAVETYLNNTDFEFAKLNEDVVILPKATWDKIHQMIKDNYDITEKSVAVS